VWIGEEKPSGLSFVSKPDVTVTYDGTQQSIKMK
jgi:hypothetical protein